MVCAERMVKARRLDGSMPGHDSEDRRDDPSPPGPDEASRIPRVRFIGETYRLLFERNPLPMWVFDVKSLYFLAVNDAALQHYGYSRNEFLRMTIKDLSPPEDAPALLTELGRINSATESIGIWRLLKRDGNQVDVEVRGNEIDFDGHRARLILANDITDRLQAERRLRTMYAVTNVLMEAPTFQAAIPRLLRGVCEEASWEYGEVWRLSPDGASLRWEGAWHVPGFDSRPLEEASRTISVVRGVGIPGTTWATGQPEWLEELSPRTHFARAVAARALGLRQGLSFPITGRGRRVLGVMVFLNRTARETDPAFLDLMKDLGDRMGQSIEAESSERERRSIEERFAKAFYRSPLPGIISRLDGSEIIDVNDSFVRAFGYAREEVVGKSAVEVNILQPVETRGRLLEPLSRGEAVRGAETVLRSKDGSLRMGRLWSDRVTMGAEPTILTIIEDVTQLRQAQAHLLESERLAAIGRTASFVAHELNTPLTNIALLTASMRRQTSDPALLERLEKVDAQRKVSAKIIEGVLSFTRSSDLTREPTDLGVLLRGAAEQADAFRKDEVRAELDLERGPIMAFVDPLKVSQVFVNLIKNAYQATDRGTVAVSLRVQPDEAIVSVRDTGSGMSRETQGRLFSAFFTTKDRGEGVGLGLTFTKAVLDAHGGRIEVASEPGKGSTFVLHLPLTRPAA